MKHLIKNVILDGLFVVATAPIRILMWGLWALEDRKRQQRLERRLRRAHPEGTRGGAR